MKYLIHLVGLAHARVTLDDIDLEKLLLSQPEIEVPKSADVIREYETLTKSTGSLDSVDDMYKLTLFGILCRLSISNGHDRCGEITDARSATRVVDSMITNSIGVVGVFSEEQLNAVIHERCQESHAFTDSHFIHAEPSFEKWQSREELIPAVVFKAAGGQMESPNFFSRISSPKESTNMKLIHLSEIYLHSGTGVFLITELPNVVIKYYSWCSDWYESRDAIVLEAFFMEKLAPIGLAPNVVYYSDYYGENQHDATQKPPKLPEPIHKSTRKLVTLNQEFCADGVSPRVRYMLMDRIGTSTNNYARDKQRNFIDAMKIGGQMILLLKKLHANRIIHGDAHWGNFAFKTDDISKPLDSGRLLMLDFGRSRIMKYGEKLDGVDEPSCTGFYAHVLNTKWEMRKCDRLGFRDDVYRAVQNSAMIIYQDKLFTYLENLAKDETMKERFKQIKDTANFFEIRSERGNAISSKLTDGKELKLEDVVAVGVDVLAAIRIELDIIRAEASNEHMRVSERPNYETIINSYRKIVLLIDPSLYGKSDDDIFHVNRQR